MSNYSKITRHPRTKKFEKAEWLDDYYGPHRYGVRFPDGEVFHADNEKIKWEFKSEKDFFNENNLNQSGDIAPIINKAEDESRIVISPDWQERFQNKYEDEWSEIFGSIELARDEIKFFIAQEIKLAEERGRKNGHDEGYTEVYNLANDKWAKQIRHSLIQEIVEKLEKNGDVGIFGESIISLPTAIEIIKGLNTN